MARQRLRRLIIALALLVSVWPVSAAESQRRSLLPLSPARTPPTSLSNYADLRAAWERSNQAWSFSYGVQLNAAETNIDQYLSALRTQEIAGGRPYGFAPKAPFYAMRNAIRNHSCVYSVLRGMPKGGALHLHSTSAGRAEWVAKTAIASNCWIQWNGNTNDPAHGTLSWSQVDTNYVRVADVIRLEAQRLPDFQRHLVSLLTIDEGDERQLAWTAWNACYSRMVSLLTNLDFFLGYMRDAFETMADDNVDYVELRTDTPWFSGANAPQGGTNCFLQYRIAEKRVGEKYPDFKLALIIAPYRGAPLSYISNHIDLALSLRSDPELRDFIVGFDLVGEEMPGTALIRAVPVLFAYLQQRTNHYRIALPFMFHGGESDWGDDDNLIDAVLLGSYRVGHAINLYRYPALVQRMRDDGCPIELCPISNQLLRYTMDMRAHPGAGYLGRGLQGVLASDDPCVFGNNGLSFDFYSAYMAWGLNLASLKQLATNSIAFSAQPAEEKLRHGQRWHQKWMAWINANQASALEYLATKTSNPCNKILKP